MRSFSQLVVSLPVALLVACSGTKYETPPDDSSDSGDTGVVDTGDSTDSGDTSETADSGDSGDSGDTGDSGDSGDTGAQAEDCADGADNDGDGSADCDDPDCADLCAEDCTDEDLGSLTGVAVAAGRTAGAGDDILPSCDPTDSASEDVTYRWTAPSAGVWRLSTAGSSASTVLTLWRGDCSGEELDCSTVDVLEREFAEGESVVIGLDGAGGTPVNYVLSILDSTATESACADGGDEDLDGLTDCDDPDCAPDAACTPETVCDDGLDDDGDGRIDCGDSDCAADASCADSCADSDLGSALGAGVASGSTVGRGDDSSPTCGSSSAEDVRLRWTAPTAGSYRFSLDGSSYDTVLVASSGDCSSLTTLDCNDDSVGTASELTLTLAAGEVVYLDVDGFSSRSGSYELGIHLASEAVCDDGLDDDGDGAADCDDSDCEASCPEDACTDGRDEDADGATDCDDTDCATDSFCLEETSCTDGIDDDSDGLTDCDDPSCADDAACLAVDCYDDVLSSPFGVGAFTVALAGDDVAGSCGAGEDALVRWSAPAAGTWTFSATPDSTYEELAIEVLSGDCSALSSLFCTETFVYSDGDPSVSVTLAAGDVVSVLVEASYGYASSASISVLPGAEFLCADGTDEDGDGASDCDDSDCAASCFELACGDGLDGDADGFTDCDDSDCAADARCLPESSCHDGTDDDFDGATDCDDSDCAGLFTCTESCFDEVIGSGLGYGVATGTTAGAGDDRAPACASTGSEDVALVWTAPATGTYTFTTEDSGFDAVLSLEEASCEGVALDCDEGAATGSATVTRSMSAGEQVILSVDGAGGASGSFVLSVYSDTETACGDGVDEDGDGDTDCDDSDCASDDNTWYLDSDGDRFGDNSFSVVACDAPAGFVPDAGDCDDSLDTVRPYAWEDTANGVDDNCDGGVDTRTASVLSLTDDSSSSVGFTGGFGFSFCGSRYTSVNVGSNGRLTFDGSSTAYSESESAFVSPPSTPRRSIAALWDDLDPGSSPSVGVFTVQHADAFSVYYRSVAEYGASTGNTFAITLFDDGRFRLDHEGIGVQDALVGWSCGTGASGSVPESDLSALGAALPAGAPGIPSSSPHALWELFEGSWDPVDLSGGSLTFCAPGGADADGDGWSSSCGDRDDTDAAVYPR